MNKSKNLFTKEYWQIEKYDPKNKLTKILLKIMYLYILISPILDTLSYMYRKYTNNIEGSSPSTYIKPIIPLVISLIILYKAKIKEKILLIAFASIYLIYIVFHILTYKSINTVFEHQPIITEIRMCINFSLLILNIYIFNRVFLNLENNKEKENKNIKNNEEQNILKNSNVNIKRLKESIVLTGLIHLILIYVSIIFKVSPTTYNEGMGLKGFFESGNSLSAILLFSLGVNLLLIREEEKRYKKLIYILISILNIVFLAMFLGTRTGFFGSILLVFTYLFSLIVEKILKYMKNKKYKKIFENNDENSIKLIIKNSKKIQSKSIKIIVGSLLLILTLILILFNLNILKLNSLSSIKKIRFIQRRSHLASEEIRLREERKSLNLPKGPLGIVKEYIRIKEDNKNKNFDEYTREEKIITKFIDYIEKYDENSTDLRRLQEIYAKIEFEIDLKDNNYMPIIFGNSNTKKQGEVVLEKELLAFWYNYGIIGTILFVLPIVIILIRSIIFGLKNILIIDSEYLMYNFIILFALTLSYLMGYVLFNITSGIILSVIITLLNYKINTLKVSKIKNEER